MSTETDAPKRKHRFPLFHGVLPLDRARIPVDVLAGVTLAALAIPEVMGYTTIAGMPVITGLYTILLPMLAFAIFGSSRHLVVGADSATAAVMAAGLVGLAAVGSDQYVALAGLLGLMAGGFLLLARLVRLGFLADFLSRSVLVGFLTGVGIQVACGQVGGLLGIPEGKGVTIDGRDFDNTIGKLIATLKSLDQISWTTVAVSAGVLIVILGGRVVTKKVPGALVAVIGAIFISWKWDLVSHGVATLGQVPGGLPKIGFPSGMGWSDVVSLMGTAVSVFILILAQSAATSRAYAAKYNDDFDENLDLVGLGVANIAAGMSGTFVVNGSPTKTEMVDGAGGRSQIAQITTGLIVLIVLLYLTAPIQYMPKAVLASVVFMIGIQLIDIRGLRTIDSLRKDEFVVAVVTAATVVLVGVEQGIVLAIVASIIDHLRRSYRPATAVIERDTDDRGFHGVPVEPDARSLPGMVVYRFSSDLFYVNANRLLEDVTAFLASGEPLEWFCIDAAAISDIDYTGAQTLKQIHGALDEHGVGLVFAETSSLVRAELERYGIVGLIGADAMYPTVGSSIRAYLAAHPEAAEPATDAGDS
jgi:SulP family sulfate permease